MQDRELTDAPFMREIVHALLPDIMFSEMPNAELDRDSLADSLLDARARIQSEFTFKKFNRLGTNLQERLIHAERFFCLARMVMMRSLLFLIYMQLSSRYLKYR